MDADIQESEDDDGGDRSGRPPLRDCGYDGGRRLPSKGGNDQQPTGGVNLAHEWTADKPSHQRKRDALTGKFDDRRRQKYLTFDSESALGARHLAVLALATIDGAEQWQFRLESQRADLITAEGEQIFVVDRAPRWRNWVRMFGRAWQ